VLPGSNAIVIKYQVIKSVKWMLQQLRISHSFANSQSVCFGIFVALNFDGTFCPFHLAIFYNARSHLGFFQPQTLLNLYPAPTYPKASLSA
jgi:hypothetical protein